MSYFTGKNLDHRIQQFGLEDFEAKIFAVVNEGDKWVETVHLTVEDPADLEPLRIVVYSILQKYGLKKRFIVRMNIYKRSITVDMKHRADEKVKGEQHGLLRWEIP